MGRFGAAGGWHVAPVALLSPCHSCACWCILVPATVAMSWVRVPLEGTLAVLSVLFGGDPGCAMGLGAPEGALSPCPPG